MRLLPRRWDAETLTCALRGHVAPGARVLEVGPQDAILAVDVVPDTRLSRCLRCDAWLRTRRPVGAEVAASGLPQLDELPRPRRGRALEDAIVTRAIAVERLVHVAIFGLLAVALALIDTDLGGLRADARSMAEGLGDAVAGSSRGGGHSWLAERLEEFADLDGNTVRALMVAAALFAAMEATEAVGLWLEKRWAEYLTVVATAVFLPLEIAELAEDGVSIVKVLALAVNVAVLVYLVWAKRLFGLRGGRRAGEDPVDWEALLTAGPPAPELVLARPPR